MLSVFLYGYEILRYAQNDNRRTLQSGIYFFDLTLRLRRAIYKVKSLKNYLASAGIFKMMENKYFNDETIYQIVKYGLLYFSTYYSSTHWERLLQIHVRQLFY